MDNVIYLSRTRKRNGMLEGLIKKYNLKTSYINEREKIIKNDDMIMMVRPKYIFICIYSEKACSLLSEIRLILEG